MNVATLAHNLFVRSHIADLQARMIEVEQQVSSGKKTQNYSGLGNDTRQHVNLNVVKQGVEAYRNTLATTQVRMETMQRVLQRIGDLAVDIRNNAITAAGETGSTVHAAQLKNAAESALREITQILNTSLDGRALFGGLDTDTPPMISPGQVATPGTPLDDVAQITALLGAPDAPLTVLNNVRQYFGVPLTTDPPGTPLGPSSNFYQGDTTGQISARIEDGVDVAYGIRGDDAAIRKVLSGLYTLATTDRTAANAAQWGDLVTQVIQNDLTPAGYEINAVVADLGLNQAAVRDAKQRQDDLLVDIDAQIGKLENVDMAESITKLSLLQNQLQASFQVTAGLRDLTLTNFL